MPRLSPRRLLVLSLAVLAPVALTATVVTLPHSFTDGSVASAGEVNANFAALKNAIDENHAGTGGLQVPVGTTAQRPATAAQGLVRYNTSRSALEYFDGAGWVAIASTVARGGTITDVGAYRLHTFTTSGTFTPGESGNVEVLVVGGGGGGGGSTAGGGGGGGVIYAASHAVTAGVPVTVTVGAGGAGSRNSDAGTVNNTSGGNSVFGTLIAYGGGYGASGRPSGSRAAASGGSGGGGGAYGGNDIPSPANGSGTPGQGYAGGTAVASGTTYYGGAGGGGAGGAGGNFVAGAGGAGGPGIAHTITGATVYYGGGGGGSGSTSGGAGGVGGGGAGNNNADAGNGTPNTGGGGGGSGTYQAGYGGGGGSGIVIVRYPL